MEEIKVLEEYSEIRKASRQKYADEAAKIDDKLERKKIYSKPLLEAVANINKMREEILEAEQKKEKRGKRTYKGG